MLLLFVVDLFTKKLLLCLRRTSFMFAKNFFYVCEETSFMFAKNFFYVCEELLLCFQWNFLIGCKDTIKSNNYIRILVKNLAVLLKKCTFVAIFNIINAIK